MSGLYQIQKKGKNIVTKNDFLKYSNHYLKLGFSVIPVGQDKKPLVKWEEFQSRKPTWDELIKWSDSFNDLNIGIVTGDISGIVVVDVEDGGSTDNLPPTITSKTGGGGYHFYYKYPKKPVKNAVRIKDKTDIRGDGGYVIAPPSLHKSGKTYEWSEFPETADFADLPEWVLETATQNEKQKVDWQQFLTSPNPQGSRNTTATQLAGKLLFHLPPDLWEIAGWSALKEWNISQNKPPLAETELRNVWNSILEQEAKKRGQNTNPQNRNPIDFQTLEQIIKKWLLINDKGIIKVLVASVIANKLEADPVWLFIVTASGGTKTELLRGLNKIDGIYPISDLTPQTFLSGEKGNKNASLLLRLPTEVILTLKDFTTVLTMHRDKRHAILSQLREIYDGQFKKEFGTGESKEWNGKMGFLAGVTSVIDHHYGIYQTLGERFVQYRPLQPDPIQLSLKAMSNAGDEKQMREEIQNAFADFIAGVKVPESKLIVPDNFVNRIAHLSAFCVRARSGVVREGYSTREIELIPEAELPTRLSKQLITFYSALSLISDSFTEDDYELIYKIGMDTLPQNRKLAINTLVQADDYMETADVAMEIGYPTNTTRRILEDLHGLQLINRQSQGKGYADRWIIKDSTKELLEKAKPESQKLIDDDTDNSLYNEAKEIFGVTTVPEMSEGSA